MNDALLILLYIVLIVFVISLTVLSIKFIGTLNKVDELVDNLTKKAQTLDGVFNAIDYASNTFGAIGEKISSYLIGTFKKIIDRKKGREDEEDE